MASPWLSRERDSGNDGLRRMKVLFVFGTRPEAIKLAPVIRELASRPDLDCRTCITGQHREMLAQVLELFELEPDWDLDLMRPNQDLAYLTGAVLSGVGEVVRSFRPDRVIVQGDTTTTFAGALAAFYNRIPVAHVEAGLRTDDIYSPWPEEVNRRLVSHIADLHFAPTSRARENLRREGVRCGRIFVTGNTGIDALLWVGDLVDQRPTLRAGFSAVLPAHFAGRRMILMTGHRRESFDGGIASISRAMARIADRPDTAVVFPVHRNPNVRQAIEPLRDHANVLLTDPVDYPELVFLLKRCHFVVTDSGGIQEEAPSFGKPVLVTRETTERPEAMELGLAKLVGTNEERLFAEMTVLLDDPGAYSQMSRIANPYGDGRASFRIAQQLVATAGRAHKRSAGQIPNSKRAVVCGGAFMID